MGEAERDGADGVEPGEYVGASCLTSKQADGAAGEGVEVVDVAQMLLAAVRRGNLSGERASV